MIWQRSSGVLLHPTSLVSPYGVGDLGPGAREYVEWLARAGVRWWQVLPLNPQGPGDSPYSTPSTFAGNPLLISFDDLLEEGLLEPEDLADAPAFLEHTVDYGVVVPWKEKVLSRAFDHFRARPPSGMEVELAAFRDRDQSWLPDYALFASLKAAHGGAPWHRWPKELAQREDRAVADWRDGHRDRFELVEFCQFLFSRQWAALRRHAAGLGVRILGDVPIFVDHDSADVWAHRELFLLDEEGRPSAVSGVPPDYFSPTGQLWGNPLYDWQRLAADGYAWWISRLGRCLDQVDAVRLDHFRGFAAYWEVPADAEVATHGRWVPGPGRALFDRVAEALGGLPFVAEDLGFITDEVIQLRKGLGLPGMAILQFGLSPDPRSTFIPYRHSSDLVVYTGTHDNNTSVGWFLEEASEGEKRLLLALAGSDGAEIHWDMIRLALGSVSDLAIVPHQDLVGLGSDCRMNRPSIGEGNWRFRITPWMLDGSVQDRLHELVWASGREVRPDDVQENERSG